MSPATRLARSIRTDPLYWGALLTAMLAYVLLPRPFSLGTGIFIAAMATAGVLHAWGAPVWAQLAGLAVGPLISFPGLSTSPFLNVRLLVPLGLLVAGVLACVHATLREPDSELPKAPRWIALVKTALVVASASAVVLVLPTLEATRAYFGGEDLTAVRSVLMGALACLALALWGWEAQEEDRPPAADDAA